MNVYPDAHLCNDDGTVSTHDRTNCIHAAIRKAQGGPHRRAGGGRVTALAAPKRGRIAATAAPRLDYEVARFSQRLLQRGSAFRKWTADAYDTANSDVGCEAIVF